MIKYTQTIYWQQSTSCLSVFDRFVGLALKGLKFKSVNKKLVLQVSATYDIDHMGTAHFSVFINSNKT